MMGFLIRKLTFLSLSEAAVQVHWMHAWHDLCLYGASQLFSVGDILDPSGTSFPWQFNCSVFWNVVDISALLFSFFSTSRTSF
jgi:hypothetical protein